MKTNNKKKVELKQLNNIKKLELSLSNSRADVPAYRIKYLIQHKNDTPATSQ